MIVDLESRTRDDVIRLQKEICKKIADFIISEKYKVIFTVSTGEHPKVCVNLQTDVR